MLSSKKRNRVGLYDPIINQLLENKTYQANKDNWKSRNLSIPSFKVAIGRRLKEVGLGGVYTCSIKTEGHSIVISLKEKVWQT